MKSKESLLHFILLGTIVVLSSAWLRQHCHLTRSAVARLPIKRQELPALLPAALRASRLDDFLPSRRYVGDFGGEEDEEEEYQEDEDEDYEDDEEDSDDDDDDDDDEDEDDGEEEDEETEDAEEESPDAESKVAEVQEVESLRVGTAHKRRRRRRVTWEDRFGIDPLRSDSPTETYEPPPERFARHFVAVGLLDGKEQIKARSKVWTHHMQWARRTALLGLAPYTETLKSAQCLVKDEYTLLSADRLAPMGQVLLLSANSSEVVLDYLNMDPLQDAGILKWRLEEVAPSSSEVLQGDVYAPFLFVGLAAKSRSAERQVQQAAVFHENAATNYSSDSVLRYSNLSRVSFHAQIYGEEVLGEVLLINARTNVDALRYLSHDPFASTLLPNPEVALQMHDDGEQDLLVRLDNSEKLVVLSPVNIQDVDGLNHFMARNYAAKAELDALHFMDPEDIFLKASPLLEGARESLVSHYEEDEATLQYLQQCNMTFKYERMPRFSDHSPASPAPTPSRRGRKLSDKPDTSFTFFSSLVPPEDEDDMDGESLLLYDAEEEYTK
eukprot:gene7862-8674_t